MKKFTSFMLMLLCAVTTWGQDVFSNDNLKEITPGNYFIYYTDANNTKHYLQTTGTNAFSTVTENPAAYKISVGGGSAFSKAYYIQMNGLCFSNPNPNNNHTLTTGTIGWNAAAYISTAVFENGEGLCALRSTNAPVSTWDENYFITHDENNNVVAIEGTTGGSDLFVWTFEEYVIDYPNELTEFNPNKCYTATLTQRGGWAVNNEGEFVSYNQAGEVAEANKQFAILSADNENYYLFSVGANAFVKKDGTTVQGIADPIVLHDASAEGECRVLVQFKGYNDGYININNSKSMDICSWSAVDHGNAIAFIEADDFNPEAALAMLNSAATVTYTFTHEGKTIAQQTATVNKGDEYPAINVTFPYGVTATKPEGTVEGAIEKTIEVEVSKELPFVTASDAASISNWYYVLMHTNQPGFIGDIADANTINVANGKVGTSADTKDNYLWGFVGNVFDGIKVVNKGTGLEMTTTGDGNVTLTENGTSLYIAETTAPGKMNATDGFCLRNPNSANYINANYTAGKLSHWRDTDAGSTFMVIEPTESLDVEITAAGYATYFWNIPAYIPEGVQAFVVNELNGTYAIMNEITGTIPANTGVVLKGSADAYSFTVAHYVTEETATAVSGNMLRGGVASEDITPAENTTYYVLANGDEGVGLYPDALSEGIFRNNANKAYLPVVAADAAASYSFNFDWAGTTAIEGVVAEGAQNGKIYDITGREVKAITTPGLYIINGVKVVK